MVHVTVTVTIAVNRIRYIITIGNSQQKLLRLETFQNPGTFLFYPSPNNVMLTIESQLTAWQWFGGESLVQAGVSVMRDRE